MKKEVIIAILIGFGIGLIITFGVITAKSAISQNREQLAGVTPSAPQKPAGTEKLVHKITLTRPENRSVVNSAKIEVSGTTTPLSVVAVMTGDSGDALVSADESGHFYQEAVLSAGANIIKIVSISPQGDKAEVSRSVVYTTADF